MQGGSAVINHDGFVILLIVILGLVPICRGGKWNWEVVQGSEALSTMFWFGWFSALLVSLLRILDLI